MPRRKPDEVPPVTLRRVRSRVRHWQRVLGLEAWRVSITVGPCEDGAAATCLAEPEYLQAKLAFDPTKIPPGELDDFVVHELCHAVCWPLAAAAHALAKGDSAAEEWVRTCEERLTTEMERLVLRLTADG